MRKISEAPISDWIVDPDLDRNEADMKSKFTGYDQEQLHWNARDKATVTDPGAILAIKKAFEKVKYDFKIVIWQSSDPDYDRTLSHGEADTHYMNKTFGKDMTKTLLDLASSGSIVFVLTNNLSDQRHIGIRSPWILGHRFAHSLPELTECIYLFQTFLADIMPGYGVEWPDEDTSYGAIFRSDYWDAYGVMMGHAIGTMRSATRNHLTNSYEWVVETLTQYLMTGDVKLKPLPVRLGEHLLTSDPDQQAKMVKAKEAFRQRIKRVFERSLDNCRGKVIVG